MRCMFFLMPCLFLLVIGVDILSSPGAIAQTTQPTLAEPFTDVSAQAGIAAPHRARWDEFSKVRSFDDGYMAIGQAWGDYNGDGWVDLYVTGNLTTSTLYQNNGDGTFRISSFSTQVSLADRTTGGATWADYDNDGWRDLYVLAYGANVLFHNEAGRGFTNVTAAAGVGDQARAPQQPGAIMTKMASLISMSPTGHAIPNASRSIPPKPRIISIITRVMAPFWMSPTASSIPKRSVPALP